MCGDSTKYISQVYILTISFFWLFIDTLDLLHHSEKRGKLFNDYNLKEKTLTSEIKFLSTSLLGASRSYFSFLLLFFF